MKNVTIVLSSRKNDLNIGKWLKNIFEEVLLDLIMVDIKFADELLEKQVIDAEVIIITVWSLYSRYRANFQKESKIILATRTFSAEMVKQVIDIPDGENVLVANTSAESTTDCINLFYELGINHLNFYSLYDNEIDMDSLNYIVTPGETSLVPHGIERVIDVGYRSIDILTFLTLLAELKIDDTRIMKNLNNYANRLMDRSTGVFRQYHDYSVLNTMLQKVMNSQKEGVIAVDNDYCIVYYNNKVSQLIESSVNNYSCLRELLPIEIYESIIKDEFDEDLLLIGQNEVLIRKEKLRIYDKDKGYFFTFNTQRNINEISTHLNKLKKDGIYAKYTFDDITYSSKLMDECIKKAKKIALTNYSVLIDGESGTGKELMAQSIHNYSQRKMHPFVAVNCAALPQSLLESELFGYEEGAFTSAKKGGKIGLFEQANNGTIFLDEIGEMTYELQSRLLRVLQERQIMRLGSNRVIDVDVRVLAATNKNIKAEIKLNKFRKDLYYRLNVFKITIPPLRDRKNDIIEIFSKMVECDVPEIDENTKQRLLKHNWDGNVRELQNVAAYYSLMNSVNCIEDDVFVQKEGEVTGSILKILMSSPYGIGRKKLKKYLENMGIIVSEVGLENYIKNLKDEELIIRSKGRGGMSITNKGIEKINSIK